MEFQTDYIFAWDFSNDAPIITVARLRAEGKQLVYDQIGVVSKSCGVVSLRQMLDEYERKQAEEKNNERDSEKRNSDDRQHIREDR